jgi:exodeoxyribonuclease VII small subunit
MVKLAKPTNFEDALDELEQIVNQIENDEIKLESALEKYQHGINLVKFCQDKLAVVEQKIKIFDTDTNGLKDITIE